MIDQILATSIILKVAEEYKACLTTTIYGDTYLDPEKCKPRGFDPIK